MSDTLSFCPEDEELMQFEIDSIGEGAADKDDALSLLPGAIALINKTVEVVPVLSPEAPVPTSQQRQPVPGNRTRRRYVADDEDILKPYLDEMGKYPLLTREDEQILGHAIREGKAAREKLNSDEPLNRQQRVEYEAIADHGKQAHDKFVKSNLRLVISVAKNYTAFGLPLPDLIQEGNLGLMHAVDKFDHRKGYRFSTYAAWWIRQAVIRGIANTGRVIHIPVRMNDTIISAKKARWELAQVLGREPTTEEIAEDIARTPQQVETALNHSGPVPSYDDHVREDGDREFVDIIEDKSALQPSEVAMTSALKEQVNNALGNLTPREARAVWFRFGLDGGGPRSSVEVGKLIGLGREAARKEIQTAMAKLRKPSVKSRLKDAAAD